MAADIIKFIDRLMWLDGKPLVIEPYRRRIFSEALSVNDDGTPKYNFALCGRAKKNYKTLDLVLVALYYLLIVKSSRGNQVYILANDRDQAADDLDLAKKLINVNLSLKKRVRIKKDVIEKNDGTGFIKILPAQDVMGLHGKTYLALLLDEIHGYKNYDILEAMAPDPHRLDEAMTWITSYDSLIKHTGIPLFDMIARGKSGTDEKMYFSWFSGDYCTDPEFDELETPEERANPSTLPDGYLQQQKLRLPSHKYRRLHLNVGGQPTGAFFNAEIVEAATRKGDKRLAHNKDFTYRAFVDMSGGSADDSTLSIAHKEADKIVIDGVWTQGRKPPFDPMKAVKLFAGIIKSYNIENVTGDRYAGQTFRAAFRKEGIEYSPCTVAKSGLYEAFEVSLNAGQTEIPDDDKMISQILMLVMKAAKIDHPSGEHDDLSNSAAGAVWMLRNLGFTDFDIKEDSEMVSREEVTNDWHTRVEQSETWDGNPY